jgi:hypothetical protein
MSGFSVPYPNQQNLVLPNQGVTPIRNQNSLAAMIGEVSTENPDIDYETIKLWLNNIVRSIYDRRTWYGLMIRGQIATTGFTIGGSVSVAQTSNQIYGANTNWNPSVVGQQFRLGFNTPPYTITDCDSTNQVLTIEMPWAGITYNSAGYFIAQYYYALGPSIRYIHVAKNMIMAWRLRLNYTQQTLDSIDPWRATVFTPTALAQMPPDSNGNYMVELWPVPSIVQALPFIAAVQPPNLVEDNNALPAAIRSDIVTMLAIAQAKTYRGPKWNKYYDAQMATQLKAEANRELRYMAKADEDLYRQDVLLPVDAMQLAPDLLAGGRNAVWDVNHAVYAGGGDGW